VDVPDPRFANLETLAEQLAATARALAELATQISALRERLQAVVPEPSRVASEEERPSD
jgi:uncharacterized coiled-coil protein SlyX